MIKIYKQKQKAIYLWHGLAFIVNQKWKSKIYELGNVDDRILVLQVVRSRSQRQKENKTRIKKYGLKSSPRLN